MNSRTKKWAHYRASIKKTPENKFPKRKEIIEETSASDEAMIASSTDALGTIITSGTKKEKGTSYSVYTKRKRAQLVVKLIMTVIAVIGFILAWNLWVMR